jgi:putative MATE family efflux protein
LANGKNHLAEIRRTLQLALPVMVGQFAVFSMSFVDTVMSGRLPERDVALAALGIGGAVWSSMLMFVLGTLMVVQPSVAQLDGALKKREAASQTRQALWIALALAVPFFTLCFFSQPLLQAFRIDPVIVPTAAAYLRAVSFGAPGLCLVLLLRFFSEGTGHTRPTMLYGVVGALLNIPLNYVLMFGKLGLPALGTVGCGIATSIVLWLQFLMLFVYIRTHRHYEPFELMSKLERPNWREIWELLKVGVPIAVAIFVEGSLFVMAALLIGRLGPVPAAAHLIAINFAALMFMIPVGLSSAVSIRVGNALGRDDPRGRALRGTDRRADHPGHPDRQREHDVPVPEAIVGSIPTMRYNRAAGGQLAVIRRHFPIPGRSADRRLGCAARFQGHSPAGAVHGRRLLAYRPDAGLPPDLRTRNGAGRHVGWHDRRAQRGLRAVAAALQPYQQGINVGPTSFGNNRFFAFGETAMPYGLCFARDLNALVFEVAEALFELGDAPVAPRQLR